MRRGLAIAVCSVLLVVGSVQGQQQRGSASLDDLLSELRALRVDMNRSAAASIRAQVLAARLTLQEGRLSSAAQQLADVRRQLAESRLRLAPSTDQIRPALETNSQILAPLRHTVREEEQRTRELREQEARLSRLIESEETRWTDFQSRLDEMDRVLQR